ncbi:MAG TPA: hypothetical protein VFX16_31280, partial [Pseudonocardiaceae bacterium]|nr:hypothetical protein [Pseudonocardiaceae bacterium]
VPFTSDYAARMTHIARAWSRHGRLDWAGEALALTVLVSATDAQEALPQEPDAEHPRLYRALYAVTAEIRYQDTVEQLADRRTLLDAIRAELRNHTKAGTARDITFMLRDLVSSLDD